MSDETMILDDLDVGFTDIPVEDIESDVPIDETVHVIEIEDIESLTVDSDEAFRALGEPNEQLRHQLLNGRDMSDQHPITAITGLRDELDSIEALKTVYSDDKQAADYYAWDDGNILSENRVGYFVSLNEDARTISIYNGGIVFGVTVDNAAFVGGQDDAERDLSYGLVVHSGVAIVRCESDVVVGDYVIVNEYGMAMKSNGVYGYPVTSKNEINGVAYATILLNISANQISVVGSELSDISDRMDDAETNIVAAMNVANAAHNKANETVNISEEALKNALEAMGRADDAIASTDQMGDVITSVNETAVLARSIAESAAVSAEANGKAAAETANAALTNVNNLVEDLAPITTWVDPETGNTGAEYLTTYINNGLATKVEVQTVETKTDDNKSAIEKSAENFRTLISSVDKYSVGEYSQSYGLTHEQAESILKDGMIYVPTKHINAPSHSETFDDIEEENWFTPGSYYTWMTNDQGIYDWVETKESVAFFSEMPIPGGALQYWYVNSDTAPDGYEPYALYKNYGGKWLKVNIFYNNPSNRMASSISQEVDKISLEITNSRESYAGLDARLSEAEAQVEMATFWNNPDSGKSNLAAMQLESDDDNSSLALVVMNKDGEQVVNGANIVLGTDGEDSYIQFDADRINFTAEDYQVIADNIKLTGVVTINDYIKMDTDGKLTATDATLSGTITANSGNIGEWKIGSGNSSSYFNGIYQDIKTITTTEDGVETIDKVTRVGMKTSLNPTHNAFYVRDFKDVEEWRHDSEPTGDTYFAVTQDGRLTATKASITGNIEATSGKIGEWTIGSGNPSSYYNGIYSDVDVTRKDANGDNVDTKVRIGMKTSPTASHYAFYIRDFADLNEWESGRAPSGKVYFAVTQNGKMTATDATISGDITATSGNFSDSVTIGGTEITAGGLRNLYNFATGGSGTPIKQIAATTGSIAGWTITDSITPEGFATPVKALYAKNNNDSIYLTPSGVYAQWRDDLGATQKDYVTWAEIVKAAVKAR